MDHTPSRTGAVGWILVTVVAVVILAVVGLFQMVF